MSIRVGEVIGVNGVNITLKIDEESNKETLFYQGEKYKGVSIREYIAIQRGFRDIICIIEGEFLDENRIETEGGKVGFVRKVSVRPIGYFYNSHFHQGIKFMPMIRDAAYLLQEKKVADIFGKSGNSSFSIGRMLKEDVPIGLPWHRLFNSHIGIFGNTGSGKSNTLAKLFTTLFDKKSHQISDKSRFIFLDFNGEYTSGQLASQDLKTVYNLSTRSRTSSMEPGAESYTKFPLNDDEFWNSETLSLLFQATQNTQRPFLTRLVEGKRKFDSNPDSLKRYFKFKFRDAFSASECRPPTLDLMRSIAKLIACDELLDFLKEVSWHSMRNCFVRGSTWFNSDGQGFDSSVAPILEQIDLERLDPFDQLILRANLQLIGDLINGYVQFEHIQPLLKRIEAMLSSIRKVLVIGRDSPGSKLLTIVSLRNCNSEAKKVIPLLLAKHYYNQHKNMVTHPPDRTIHLVIDEAHNILSQQSSREHESWKDYRLELFEEIIKEGRKFGIFVTIASQRPADISPTIVSQVHNFFIHRLVNDRDLQLIDNTVTTLDSLSRGLIPNLAQGCCVVTGTAFDVPMILQIDRMPKAQRPDSEDVDLEKLWS